MKPTYFDWELSPEKPFVVHFQNVRPAYSSDMDFDFHRSIHINIALEGAFFCDIRSYPYLCNCGECMLTAPWEPHRLRRSDSGARICMIAMNLDDAMKFLLADGRKLTALLMLPPDARHNLLREKGLMRYSDELGGKLCGADGNLLRGWQAIVNFLFEITGGLDGGDIPDEAQADYMRLRPALQMINAGKGVTDAADAARACDLSVSRFRAVFRQVFHRPFASYELQYRLQGAADDIVKTGMTVKAAAFEWGFFDASHFSRLFKRSFGMAPGQYLKSRIRNPENPHGE